ncbi:protein kinase [Verrucomicrobium sp. BvORR106]|uniref:serine/threonine protein kinase n=1 Tax=Verrucomicrobium sp. BvORR106 TaxID=1403819 RepID=UPI0009DE8DE7|nr:protein kinase [Verrucomicrobium sp. BvORR106]
MDPNHIAAAEEVALKLGLKLISFCGAGAYKVTYKTATAEGQIVALKLADRSKCTRERTERETEALKKCSSEFVAKVISVSEHTSDRGTFDVIVEEYLDGGTLDERLLTEKLGRQDIVELLKGLVHALAVLREARLVHRDIKPTNVMFRSGHHAPVLVDFGLVRDLSQSSMTVSWMPNGPGTPYYSSPEQLNNDKALIGWHSDQFSVGVMIAELILDRHPFQSLSMTSAEAIQSVVDRKFIPPCSAAAFEKMRMRCLVQMLKPWPALRYQRPEDLINAIEIE